MHDPAHPGEVLRELCLRQQHDLRQTRQRVGELQVRDVAPPYKA